LEGAQLPACAGVEWQAQACSLARLQHTVLTHALHRTTPPPTKLLLLLLLLLLLQLGDHQTDVHPRVQGGACVASVWVACAEADGQPVLQCGGPYLLLPLALRCCSSCCCCAAAVALPAPCIGGTLPSQPQQPNSNWRACRASGGAAVPSAGEAGPQGRGPPQAAPGR